MMEQGEVGCVNGWWMAILQDLSNNTELWCYYCLYFFDLITVQPIIWLCSYSTVLPANGMPIKFTMQTAVQLLVLADVVFAWKVFTPLYCMHFHFLGKFR